MKTITIIILLLLNNFNIDNSINGIVIDDNKEVLAGVKVVLDSKEIVYTDFNGEFRFEVIKDNSMYHTLSLSLITYKNKCILLKKQDFQYLTLHIR